MTSEQAEKLLIAASAVDNAIGVIMFLIEDYLEGNEKSKFSKAITAVGATFFSDFQYPIINAYPEFTPSHLQEKTN
jgi:hypothetical protein